MGCSQSSTEAAVSPSKKVVRSKALSKSPQPSNKKADNSPLPRSPGKDNKAIKNNDTK